MQGRSARFGRGWTVERARLLDLIDRMRSAVPSELESARAVLRERDALLADAKEETQILLTKARQEADLRVDSHDLVLEAQRRASEIVAEATRQAQTIVEETRSEAAAVRGEAVSQAVEQTLEADRYSLDVLRRLEAQLTALDTSVRAGIQQLDQKLQREEEQAAADARDAVIREQHAERNPPRGPRTP